MSMYVPEKTESATQGEPRGRALDPRTAAGGWPADRSSGSLAQRYVPETVSSKLKHGTRPQGPDGERPSKSGCLEPLQGCSTRKNKSYLSLNDCTTQVYT